MAKQRKRPLFAVSMKRVHAAIIAAKKVAKNKVWKLLHRMESMAARAIGTKTKTRKKTPKDEKGNTKGKK